MFVAGLEFLSEVFVSGVEVGGEVEETGRMNGQERLRNGVAVPNGQFRRVESDGKEKDL